MSDLLGIKWDDPYRKIYNEKHKRICGVCERLHECNKVKYNNPSSCSKWFEERVKHA